MKCFVRFSLMSVWVVIVAILLVQLWANPGATAGTGIVQPPRIAVGGSTSTNWSGYAVPSSSVSDVNANWTVPSVTCSRGKQYSSIWVGIDGFNSKTVEQTGTEQDCNGSTAHYFAWYEMYPALPVNLSMTIHHGDQMYAEVQFLGSGQFTLTITDVTTSATFSVTKTLATAKRSSAEWIVEAPSSILGVLKLANFGTAFLSNAQATIGGTTGSIGSFSGNTSITMATKGVVKAQPSSLTNGGADFKVVWKHR